MPSTSGFEVVGELTRGVLVQDLQGAWDQSTVPHSVPIAAGLAFGPHQVATGTVNIPRDGLDIELVPATNRVRCVLGTNVQVEIANPPVPSARFFDMTTRTTVDLPIGTVPNTINVGVLLSQIARNEVDVDITSGDSVAPLTFGLIAEYVHARYVDGTIPHSITQTNANLGAITADAYVEFFDDASDPARRIGVGPGAGPNRVKITLPARLRLSNISLSIARSPMAVTATIAIDAPLDVAAGNVSARLSAATTTVENLAPAAGTEGTNYTVNATGFPAFPGLLTNELQRRGEAVVTAIGDVTVAVPTMAAIEAFAGDRTFDALRNRGDIPVWTPQTAGSPVDVRDVSVKVLADVVAFCLNAGAAADPSGVTDFVPAGKSCAVAVDGQKVVDIINAAISAPEPKGLGHPIPPPKIFDNIEGRRVQLNSLTPSLINGFIQLRGSVTVFDAIAGSIDVDADFTAKLVLKWVDTADGHQELKAELSGEPDVDLSVGAWILGLILGFFTLGVIGVIIVAVVLSIADDLAETVGGGVIRDQVTGRVQNISAWPLVLEGTGTVVSEFDNPVQIDPQSVMFPDAYVVHATFESTADALADANGPYAVNAGAPVQFAGGPAKPDTDYAWDFGDGASAIGMNATHRFGDEGIYVARLTTTVNQPGGVTTHHFAAVRARNVPPSVDAGGLITIDEGEEVDFVARFTDDEWLDTHEATFFFGDDSLPVAATIDETNDEPRAVGTARARHAYCDNGEYTLTVQVVDDDGGVGVDTRTVVVRNVAPTVDAGPDLYVLPGMPVTLRACFTDPGWCDTHTATWDPGDCSPVQTAIVREHHDPPAGIGSATTLHGYERCGTYVATCTVTDDDGGLGVDSIVVRVVDLLNGDFEAGFRDRGEGIVASGWEPYGRSRSGRGEAPPFFADEFVVHGGQRSQGIAVPAGGRLGLRQRLGTMPGWDYQVAAWYEVAEATRDVRVRLGIDPAGGEDPDDAGIAWCERGPSDAWAELAERVTAASDGVTVFLEVQADRTPGRVRFDDVVVLGECCQVAECVPAKPDPGDQRCLDFRRRDRAELQPEASIDGFDLVSLDGQPLRIDQGGQPPVGGLRIPGKGVQVTLPFRSTRVEAEILTQTKAPVRMLALDDAGQVVMDVSSTQASERLVVRGDIVWVVLSEGVNEALLLELCAERDPHGERGASSVGGRAVRARKGR